MAFAALVCLSARVDSLPPPHLTLMDDTSEHLHDEPTVDDLRVKLCYICREEELHDSGLLHARAYPDT